MNWTMTNEMTPLVSRGHSVASRPQRVAIRLMFPGFVLCGFFLLAIRSFFGEPYPGPFMPAFAGNGLHMISDTEGALAFSRITVGFSDHSSTEIPMNSLFNDGPVSSRHAMLFLIAPNPDTPVPPKGLKAELHHWFDHHFRGYHETDVNTVWNVPDDVRDYLFRRLVKLYPQKTPASLTIAVYQYTFPLDNFLKPKTTPISQTTIRFHSGVLLF